MKSTHIVIQMMMQLRSAFVGRSLDWVGDLSHVANPFGRQPRHNNASQDAPPPPPHAKVSSVWVASLSVKRLKATACQQQVRAGSVVIIGELPCVFIPCNGKGAACLLNLGVLNIDLRRSNGMYR